MSLKYDFDLVPVFGADVFSQPGHDQALKSAGIAENALSNYVASFRDPATAEALRGADDVVKAMFKNAGFGFLPSRVALPDFHFNAAHGPLRDAVLNRLAGAQEDPNLKDADWNGFEFAAFLSWTLTARPVQQPTAAQPATPGPARAQSSKPRKSTGISGNTIRFALFFVVLLVIVWQVTTGTNGGLLNGIIEALSFEPQSLYPRRSGQRDPRCPHILQRRGQRPIQVDRPAEIGAHGYLIAQLRSVQCRVGDAEIGG